MAPVTKFTFDLNFDAPKEALQPEPVEEVQEVEEEVVPTFSEDELAQARAEGFEAGKEEGRKESAEATEQRILETIESVAENLAQIINNQVQANHDIAQEMIEISTAIAKKMFPDLNARNALGEVERVVQDTLKAITDEPRVQIMVHPDLREPLTDRIDAMTQRAGFDGKVYVNPDTTVNLGDCRVEWSHGAAVRDSETIMEQIDEIIKRNLHGEDTDHVATADNEALAENQIDDQPNDSIDVPEVDAQTAETDEMISSDPEPLESMTDDAQATTQIEPMASIENTVDDTSETLPLDTADQDLDMGHDNFTPSMNIDDDLAALESDSKTQENQQLEPDLGDAPVPHVDLEQDQITDAIVETTDVAEEPADDLGRTVSSDPVSPDMTAAILDAQGAMSEEDEK